MRFPTALVGTLACLLVLAACGPIGALARTPASHRYPAVATFRVSGTDGGAGIDITYGSQNANLQGGSKLPWSTTVRIDPAAQFYDVQAQLNGAGSITCWVWVEGVTKTTHAKGGYDVCRAEVTNDLNGKWLPSSAS